MTTRQAAPKAITPNDALFSWVMTAVFFVVGVIGLKHHAMWRDETYPWMMATASHSLRELYLVARYDTHFMLWHLLLWVLARFTRNCEAMQWLHLALATVGVWLVVRFSPFTRLQKALYCFGYFTAFEYCLVCREYVCVVVLLFSLCALCDWHKDSLVLQSVILFLLSNFNVFATFIAFAFVGARVLEEIHGGNARKLWARRKRALIASGLILCAALLGDGLQSIKPADALAPRDWVLTFGVRDFAVAFSNVWRGYVPIARPFPHWAGIGWGTNFLLDRGPEDGRTNVILSLALLAASTWTLRRSRMAMTWYLGGTGLMLAFESVITPGALRHHGFFFILYLACLWSRSIWGPDQKSKPATANPSARWERFFVQSILIVQVVAGVYMWAFLYTTPFSGSKMAADFIRQHGYANLLIIGDKEPNVLTVAAYLDKPIYYLYSERLGTFFTTSSAEPTLPAWKS